jgi:hypothetical protein
VVVSHPRERRVRRLPAGAALHARAWSQMARQASARVVTAKYPIPSARWTERTMTVFTRLRRVSDSSRFERCRVIGAATDAAYRPACCDALAIGIPAPRRWLASSVYMRITPASRVARAFCSHSSAFARTSLGVTSHPLHSPEQSMTVFTRPWRVSDSSRFERFTAPLPASW